MKGLASCPMCDAEGLRVVTREDTFVSDDGVSVHYIDEYSFCDACEREFYTAKQSKENSRRVAEALGQAQDLPTPATVKALREGLGLKQVEFERALGVGKKTVVRWERGTVAPGGAARGMLWLAQEHPVVFAKWAEKNGVRLTPRTAAKACRTFGEVAKPRAFYKVDVSTDRGDANVVSSLIIATQVFAFEDSR